MERIRRVFALAEAGDGFLLAGCYSLAIRRYQAAAEEWRKVVPILQAEGKGLELEQDWPAVWEGKRMAASLLLHKGRTPRVPKIMSSPPMGHPVASN